MIRVNDSRKITHKNISCRTTWEFCHIYGRVAALLAARFSNLTKFECSHRRGALTYTHGIFHNKCKDLIMQHENFQIYKLKINTIIWHCKKKSDYFWTRVYESSAHQPAGKTAMYYQLQIHSPTKPGNVRHGCYSVMLYNVIYTSFISERSPRQETGKLNFATNIFVGIYLTIYVSYIS